MFSENDMNLYFNPGCALSIYKPERVLQILDYLKKIFPFIKLHQSCCHHKPGLPTGSVIINVCAGCDRRFSSLHKGISTVSLWEIIDEFNDFPFQNYNGMRVSIHDPCPVRNKMVVHKAVRNLLKKMNIEIIETSQHGTSSVCCGDSLYLSCDSKEIHAAMKKRADSMPCEDVVVYCVSCIKAMSVGGKIPHHLVDLLFHEATQPQECSVNEWHDVLDAYIAVH